MTVADLIKTLQTMDPSAVVMAPQGEHGDIEEIRYVTAEVWRNSLHFPNEPPDYAPTVVLR